jgi:site-specific recombinase XerC
MTLEVTETFDICQFEEMTEQIKDYMAKSRSDATRRAYRNAWKDFDLWCLSNGLVSLPAMPLTIASYLIERAQTLKIATLEQRLVAIRQAHLYAGFEWDKNDVIIANTFKGIRNTHGAPQVRKEPIILDDLQKMVYGLGNDPVGIRDRAILLLGFTGAFRRSELVSLQISDLNFKREGIEVFLRKSKTDQEMKGATIPIPYGSNPETCPVRAIGDWLQSAEIDSGPLFRAINKHGHISNKALCSKSVALIIKRNGHIKDNKGWFLHSSSFKQYIGSFKHEAC